MYDNKEVPKNSKKNKIVNDRKSSNFVVQKNVNMTGMPDNLKSGIENLSGYSMDDVKVHYNSDKPAQLNAHAYAKGSDIHLASGQEKHLSHEAWHVVQQKQGRVNPTIYNSNNECDNNNKITHKVDNLRKGYNKILNPTMQMNKIKSADKKTSEQVGKQSKTGFEIELRGFVVYAESNVDLNPNVAYKITEGGDDGFFSLDQIVPKDSLKGMGLENTEEYKKIGNKAYAIIEWSSNPDNTRNSENVYNKLSLIEKVAPKNRTTLSEFIKCVNQVVKIGNIVNTYSNYEFEFEPNKTDHVQVNIDLPFENIGVKSDDDSDIGNLFNGKDDNDAKSIFNKSRDFAHILVGEMIDKYADYKKITTDQISKSSLISLITIFLHTIISKQNTKSKDNQGVLFKSGAGDITRMALDEPSKSVLWYFFNGTNREKNINRVIEESRKIYSDSKKTQLLNSRKEKMDDDIAAQIKKTFVRVNLKNDKYNNEDSVIAKQKHRYGDELVGYSSKVNPARLNGISTLDLSGVATGKYFPVINHLSTDEKVSASYIIGETRRKSNEFAELATTDNTEKRIELEKKLIEMQKPKYVSEIPEQKTKTKCGCFLTSACVRYKGFSDDCIELTLLRNFRDGYLSERENGKEVIAHYYSCSPFIVAAIERHNNRDKYYEYIYSVIQNCIHSILCGRNEDAYSDYYSMVVSLSNELTPEYSSNLLHFGNK